MQTQSWLLDQNTRDCFVVILESIENKNIQKESREQKHGHSQVSWLPCSLCHVIAMWEKNVMHGEKCTLYSVLLGPGAGFMDVLPPTVPPATLVINI